VQVDLVLHAEVASREFAHGAFPDRRAVKSQTLAAVALGVVDVRLEAFTQDSRVIGARESSPGRGLANDIRGPPGRSQRLRIGKRPAEQISFVIRHGIGS
jgi:hypothetical protein